MGVLPIWPASDRDPCPRCGVRADVDCDHRPGVGQPPAFTAKVDRRKKTRDGMGYNFHRRRPA